MYTNILIPTDGSELAGKAVEHGIDLAERIGAKVTVLTVLPTFHTFTTDTQMIEDTPVQYKARMQKQAANTRRHPRRAGSGRRMRGRPGRARASLPGDHRYRGVERLRSNRHGFAWPPRHVCDCPRQRDSQGPYSLQNPDAGPSLSCEQLLDAGSHPNPSPRRQRAT